MEDAIKEVLLRLDRLEKQVETIRLTVNENAEVMTETIDILNERERVRDKQFDYLHGRMMTAKEKAVWTSKMEAERRQRGQDRD